MAACVLDVVECGGQLAQRLDGLVADAGGSAVLGIALGLRVPWKASRVRPEGSKKDGYGTSYRRSKASPCSGRESLVFTPTNATSRLASSRATDASMGASLRHGGHHDPHTFSTTTWPAKSASDSFFPSRVVPETSFGALRSSSASRVMIPCPLT